MQIGHFLRTIILERKKIPCHVRCIILEADPVSLSSRIEVKMRNLCSTHYLIIKKPQNFTKPLVSKSLPILCIQSAYVCLVPGFNLASDYSPFFPLSSSFSTFSWTQFPDEWKEVKGSFMSLLAWRRLELAC